MALPTLEFNVEERSLLRAAFLRLIPFSDEAAARLYAPFGLTEEETIEEAVRHLAAVADALESPDAFAEACRLSKIWHRTQSIPADLGAPFVRVLKALAQSPTPGEIALWRRLWESIAAAPTD